MPTRPAGSIRLRLPWAGPCDSVRRVCPPADGEETLAYVNAAVRDSCRLDRSGEESMTTRAVSRRAALRRIGAGAGALTLLPFLSDEGLAAFVHIQGTKAAPSLKVLSPSQYATLEALVEAIIPADERSPGAREARVADYFDLVLSEAQPSLKEEWLAGLAAFDAEATRRFGKPFLRLDAGQVETLLTDVSRFEAVKTKPEETAREVTRYDQPTQKPVLVEGLLGDVSRFDPDRPRPPLEAFFATT